MRSLKGRLRTTVIRFGQFAVGRRLTHLDQRWHEEEGLLEWGRYSLGYPRIHWRKGDTGKVIIGSFTGIADCHFFTGSIHRIDWITTFPLRAQLGLPNAEKDGPYSHGDIVVGNDVWIGWGAAVFSGVNIGNGAVIGTNAVVTKDVRPYAIVAGNPGREIRRRFSDEQIEALERIAWWDWPDEQIRANADLICSDRVDELIVRFG